MGLYGQRHIDGTSPRKISEYYYTNVYYEKEKVRAKKHKGHKFNSRFVVCIMMLSVTFLIAIAKYAAITELNYRIVTLTKEYNKVKNENSKLLVELRDKTDTNKIKDLAESKLGMHSSSKYQTIYVDIPKRSYIKSIDNKIGDKTNRGAVARVVSSISKALEGIF